VAAVETHVALLVLDARAAGARIVDRDALPAVCEGLGIRIEGGARGIGLFACRSGGSRTDEKRL
jgi:hypothetical protein